MKLLQVTAVSFVVIYYRVVVQVKSNVRILTTIWYIASTILYISSRVIKPSLSTSYSLNAPVKKKSLCKIEWYLYVDELKINRVEYDLFKQIATKSTKNYVLTLIRIFWIRNSSRVDTRRSTLNQSENRRIAKIML